MNRRRVLAALATTLTAGCVSQSRPTTTPSNNDLNAADATNTTTSGTTTTTTDTATTDTTTETSTTTDETTTETTTTTTDSEQAAEHMTTAKRKLNNSVAIYSEFAGTDAGYLGVDARTKSFNSAVVETSIDDAESALSKAKETASDSQLDTVSKLEDTAAYLQAVSRTQAYTTDAYAGLKAAVEGLFSADFETANPGLEKLKTSRSSALNAFQNVESFNANAITAFSGLSKSQVADKEAQLRTELDAFGVFETWLDPTISASEDLATGIRLTMVDEADFRTATRLCENAEAGFKDANNAYSSVGSPSYLNEWDASAECYLGVMDRAATCYRAAAENSIGQDNHWKSHRDRWAGRGRKALKKCESTHGLRAIY